MGNDGFGGGRSLPSLETVPSAARQAAASHPSGALEPELSSKFAKFCRLRADAAVVHLKRVLSPEQLHAVKQQLIDEMHTDPSLMALVHHAIQNSNGRGGGQ